MRLFTPAAHARARRFYEREGWVAAGDEFHDAGPNLALVEYRRALGARELHRQAPEQRARQMP
jgi:hypothetical protein